MHHQNEMDLIVRQNMFTYDGVSKVKSKRLSSFKALSCSFISCVFVSPLDKIASMSSSVILAVTKYHEKLDTKFDNGN